MLWAARDGSLVNGVTGPFRKLGPKARAETMQGAHPRETNTQTHTLSFTMSDHAEKQNPCSLLLWARARGFFLIGVFLPTPPSCGAACL